MWTCFVFSVYISVAVASEPELFDYNGWIPVSNDIVYNQIRRGITQVPRFTKADTQILNNNLTSQHQDEGVGTERDHFESNIDEDHNKDSTTYNDDAFNNEPRMTHKYDVFPNNVITEATVRRSKKLVDIDSHVLLNQLLPNNDKTEQKSFFKTGDYKKIEDKFTKGSTHTYEVIENITIEDDKQEETAVKANRYEQNRPHQQNFLTDFNKHLSKYENDYLQNYALSRRTKADNHVKQDLQNKLRFREPIRYNSLNHLPVDPLLAVFLSNYGHYLQGQYGISNNYNNLYGYLASNNIHNNRPFGFYKLFSDTDSSNK